MDNVNLTGNKYSCNLCTKTFSNRARLNRHFISHVEARPFNCTVCKKKFKSNDMLSKHFRIHSRTKNEFQCKKCFKFLASQYYLTLHEKRHNPDYIFKCEHCDMKFVVKSELTTHTVSKHEKAFLCPVCGKQLASKYSLDYHIKSHDSNHKNTIVKCDKCDYTCHTDRNLNRHFVRAHTQNERHVCDVCGKGLTSMTSFREHKMLHEGVKPYECDRCRRKFSKKATLKSHTLTHTGERPFSCSVCGKGFTQRTPLKRHETSVHLKQMPFKCATCQVGFSVKRLLVQHEKIKHKRL